jgi:hypothetical protein
MYNFFLDDPILRRICSSVAKQSLIVEGFGGSANTFSWLAIRSANPDLVFSHHLHVPAHVIAAVKYKVPAILIVRDPTGSVVSLYSRGYIPSLKQGFRHYIMFHQKLLPYVDRVLVASFSEVTRDMGEVIRRCNDMFGTNFTPFIHTEDNVKACRGKIKKASQVSSMRNAIKETTLHN